MTSFGGREYARDDRIVVLSEMSCVQAWPLCIALLVVAASTAPPAADDILRQVADEGARVVVSRLLVSADTFEKVCERIESGESTWLQVARALKPGTDAATTFSINYAVARALPAAPASVLALIDRGFTLEDVCTSPFIEPKPGVAERYTQRTVEALQKPVSAELEGVRMACLRRVRAAIAVLSPSGRSSSGNSK